MLAKLGPPEDEDYYPFTQIQGFWQVDARSVQIGLMTASNLLDDNRRSGVNEELVNMVYNEQFNSISLIAMDNVAVNGNAMFSVLRNACGQSSSYNDDEILPCGANLVRPNMQTNHKLPVFWNIVLFVVYGSLIVMVSVMLLQAFRLRNQGPQVSYSAFLFPTCHDSKLVTTGSPIDLQRASCVKWFAFCKYVPPYLA